MTAKSPLPFETMVFVCTHQRAPGERTACANAGREGQEIVERLRKMVLDKGLAGKVRICKSGCMDRCEEGPNVVVTRANGQTDYFSNASLKNIKNICEVFVKDS
ncbi:MAG: (2Fe-2S) ferredoxin domain-containing protein [Elusimicrobia bacterium]|nr:(2Fe-2S) ferredoxin domain-containing protein [Elusimicrobiota bacterium]